VKSFFAHPVVSFLLKILVSVSLLVGLVFFIDFGSLIRSLQNAHPQFLLLGCLLTGANIGFHFIRWRYLLRLISKDISNGEALVSLLVGISAGIFTPGQIGEFAGRMASHPGLRKSEVAGISVIDKLYLLGLTWITGIISLLVFAAFYWKEYFTGFYTGIGISIVVLLTLLFLFPETTKKLFRFIPAKIREHKLYAVIGIIETTFHNKQGRMLFSLTLMLYMAIFFQFYVFILAFQPVSLFDSIVCSSSVYFVKALALPISFGDLGIRESASVFFFAKVGVPSAAAFNASLCMFFTNLVFPSIAGAVMIPKLKLKQK
jgi:uncharacterized protein (TIRG00374 family)